jgi:uncharacterized membrane protein YecN with MAPEG domain
LPIPIIVPAYAGLLALLFILLSVQVVRARGATRIAIGTGGNPALERAHRVHANFAEYVPFALLLFGFVEMHRWSSLLVHLLCLMLLLGRLVHAFGMSQQSETLALRATGIGLTVTAIAIAAVLLLVDGLRV